MALAGNYTQYLLNASQMSCSWYSNVSLGNKTY
jgi:capsule polysaccharide modification protein KpsS